jgi:hypothetical protein
MNAIPFIVMVGLGAFVFYIVQASQRYRADAIRSLASRSGMQFLGNALPKSLGLDETPFRPVFESVECD